jgi:hypothetical protein
MSPIDQPLMLVPQASAQRLELLGHGLPGNSQPSPSGGHRSADPGRGRDPGRGLPERVKRMVGRVLNGNGITEQLQGRYRLVGSVAVRLLRRSRAGLA